MAEGKGNKKRSSALQKKHYETHPFRIDRNRVKRLERHVRRNAYQIRKKARRGIFIAVDEKAASLLRRLANGSSALHSLASAVNEAERQR